MATISAPGIGVRADSPTPRVLSDADFRAWLAAQVEADGPAPFGPTPTDHAWALGHALGLDGVDATPDAESTRAEADAFRRGYAAGLDAGGWSLDLSFLDERQGAAIDPLWTWDESELVRCRSRSGHPAWEG